MSTDAAIPSPVVDPTTEADTVVDLRRRLAEAESKIAHLETALESSRDIGAAMGILMAAHRITTDDAFDMLRRCSQNQHRKLRDVASDVVHTGVLPVDGGPAAP